MKPGLAILAALALVPAILLPASLDYLLFPATRILVFALAAISLDLILGVGGLVSFGQAAFMGIGAYAIGIAASYGLTEGLLTIPLAMAAAALFALATGAIALRTTGVYFIMITLAFGQMAFFTASSLAPYGGDDGMTLPARTTWLGWPGFDNRTILYYAALLALALALLALTRLARSRFGRVLRGASTAPRRIQSLGYDPYAHRLAAYTIAGALSGLAGALLANATEFVSPAYMAWQRSGDLLIMVILGGAGSLYGAILGTIAYLALADLLAAWTEHWRIILGPLLVLAVLSGPGGLARFRAPGWRAQARKPKTR